MGTQKRYATEPTARLEHATGSLRESIGLAIERINAAVPNLPGATVFDGRGLTLGPVGVLGGELDVHTGPDHYRHASHVRGDDGRLLVLPTDTPALIEERVYLVFGCESRAGLWHRRVADVLYAGIGMGRFEVVPTRRVEATAARTLASMPPAWLVQHCVMLREHLGLPTVRWSESAWDAAIRGRKLAARM